MRRRAADWVRCTGVQEKQVRCTSVNSLPFDATRQQDMGCAGTGLRSDQYRGSFSPFQARELQSFGIWEGGRHIESSSNSVRHERDRCDPGSVLPRACSGAMYAAVPRIMPACASARWTAPLASSIFFGRDGEPFRAP